MQRLHLNMTLEHHTDVPFFLKKQAYEDTTCQSILKIFAIASRRDQLYTFSPRNTLSTHKVLSQHFCFDFSLRSCFILKEFCTICFDHFYFYPTPLRSILLHYPFKFVNGHQIKYVLFMLTMWTSNSVVNLTGSYILQ